MVGIGALHRYFVGALLIIGQLPFSFIAPNSNMRTNKSYRKSLLCGGVLLGLLILFVAVTDVKGLRRGLPYLFMMALISTLAVCLWSSFSRKSWSVLRHAITVFVFFPGCILVWFASVSR